MGDDQAPAGHEGDKRYDSRGLRKSHVLMGMTLSTITNLIGVVVSLRLAASAGLVAWFVAALVLNTVVVMAFNRSGNKSFGAGWAYGFGVALLLVGGCVIWLAQLEL